MARPNPLAFLVMESVSSQNKKGCGVNLQPRELAGSMVWLLLAAAPAIPSDSAVKRHDPARTSSTDDTVHFEKFRLDDRYRSEGVAVGDFNRDGQMDVAAGSLYYASPDWRLVPFGEEALEYEQDSYSHSFANYADDVNGDGWTDLIVVGFPGKSTWWLENSKGKAEPWKRHEIASVTNNESPQMVDVDGDGSRELIFALNADAEDPDGPHRRMAILRRTASPSMPWQIRTISAAAAPGTKRYDHGLGVGDLNLDGRLDVLVRQGWWEAPKQPARPEWQFHAAPFGPPAAHMHVRDFDADGDADVLSSSAHGYGIWWHEQTPEGWRRHNIDDSFSQTHSLCLSDINGDGLMDFVTGKRRWAHNGRDPGGNDPSVFCWYELTRRDGRVEWIRHPIDRDSGVGTQFEVADVDQDGLLDIVSSNKNGVFFFRQVRTENERP